VADLVVTSVAVDDAARQLKVIQDEFEKSGARREDREDMWGHPAVKSAMDDFDHDWRVKREKLTENIKDLQTKMQKAAETWGSTEISLADSLKPADP
jgi:hypothetical protein